MGFISQLLYKYVFVFTSIDKRDSLITDENQWLFIQDN